MKIKLMLLTLNSVMCLFDEKYRPQIHFSPPKMWMNDPNGLVYHKGLYHLFYQHNPFANVYGPMHWGHAISLDLIHWMNLPIALSPDSHGTIFSGCALVDYKNVTGFQKNIEAEVLIAVFTQQILIEEEEPQEYIQHQSLAYSNDNGYEWEMYENNPILEANVKNKPRIDFRDPKIFKFKDYFVMVLAAFDRIIFYRSKNLLNWTKLSEFGVRPNSGDHGGVWECPDLIYFSCNNVWVLLVSVNPGGPNNGSATQYFIGRFDGKSFRNLNPSKTTLWVDYGPDSYAGITWVGKSLRKKVFISWMNNWNYAENLPTDTWRGQMTIPRYLAIAHVNNEYYLRSTPINLGEIRLTPSAEIFNISLTAVQNVYELQSDITSMVMNVTLLFNVEKLSKRDYFQLCFSNEDEELCTGFKRFSNEYFIDRSKVGNSTFDDMYTVHAFAPRLVRSKYMHWQIIIDVTSLELFADYGLSVMTSLFFPFNPLTRIELHLFAESSSAELILVESYFESLQSIWN